MTEPSPRLLRVWLAAILLVTFAAYAPTLHYDFCWDDRLAAMGSNGQHAHPLVAELRPIGEYFSNHYWPHVTPVGFTYRPLTTLSFALRYAVVGDHPQVAHAINVALHVLATWLAFCLLRAVGARWVPALLGTAVFGLHAIHSEAVTSVVGRAELLGFAGAAGAFLLLLRARGVAGPGRGLLRLAACALLFGAFCSKESALAWVAFTPLCFLVRGWAHPPAAAAPTSVGWRDRASEAAVVLLPALAFLALRARMIAHLPGTVDPAVDVVANPLLHAGFVTRALTGLMMWGYGLLLTLLPYDLAIDYGPAQFPIVTGFGQPEVFFALVGGAAIGGLLVGGLIVARRHPLLFLATACFLGFSFIVSNIPFACFMLFGERTYYTPSFGGALLVAWAAAKLTQREALRGPALVALGVWLGMSLHVLVDHNAAWRDNATLVSREVHDHPRSVRLLREAAADHAVVDEMGLAQHYYERAVALDPGLMGAWIALAAIYREAGELDRAAAALQAAATARRDGRGQLIVRLHSGRARLHLAQGDATAALTALDACVAEAPDYLATHQELRRVVSNLATNGASGVRERAQRLLEAAVPLGR
ncbi:MAG: hypothetical protein AAF628_16785 [Planctomycetota bacterium]